MSSGGDHSESDAYRPLEGGANGDGEPVAEPKQNNEAKVNSPAVEFHHQGQGESVRDIEDNDNAQVQDHENEGQNMDDEEIDNSLSIEDGAENDQILEQNRNTQGHIEVADLSVSGAQMSGSNSIAEGGSSIVESADNSFHSDDSQVKPAKVTEISQSSTAVDRDSTEPEGADCQDVRSAASSSYSTMSTVSTEHENIPVICTKDSEDLKGDMEEDQDADGDGFKHGQAYSQELLQTKGTFDVENPPFANQEIDVDHLETPRTHDQGDQQQQAQSQEHSHHHNEYQAFEHDPPHHHPHVCSNVLEASHKHSGENDDERVYMYVADRGSLDSKDVPQAPGHQLPTNDDPKPTESSQSLYSFVDSLDEQVTQPDGRDNAVVGEEDGVCLAHLQNNHRTVSAHPEYPVNYYNYKVCRQVEPGVKECLILETGEHITCRKTINASELASTGGKGDAEGCGTTLSQDHEDTQSSSVKSEPSNHMSNKSESKEEKSTNSNKTETGRLQNEMTSVPKEIPEEINLPKGNLKTGSTANKFSQESPKSNESPSSEPVSPTTKAGFKIVHKNREGALTFGNFNLARFPEKQSNGTAEGDRSENGLESPKHRSCSESSSSKEAQRDAYRSQHSVSDRSSIEEQNVFDALEGLESRDDVYVYETESDLRNFTEPQPTYSYNRWTEGTNQNQPASSPFTRPVYSSRIANHAPQNYITDHQSHLTNTRTEPSTSDNIDMSALYRAERWLDDRATPLSPRRHNLSTSVSSTGSGPIPGFRTLQEQQASWMNMFKLLEEQHQTDLVTQYKQHQKNIHNLQEQIESDLCRQQDSFQKKLDVHREIMLQNASYAGSYLPPDFDAEGQSSLPRPIILEDEEGADNLPGDLSLAAEDSEYEDSIPGRGARRSLENSFTERGPGGVHSLSASRFVDPVYSSSLNRSTGEQHTRSRIRDVDIADDGDDKTFQSYLNESHQPTSQSLRRNKRGPPADDLLEIPSYQEEVNYSHNANGSLREKHSNHLADLRVYYEQELSELKAALTTPEFIKSQSPYKKVMEENLQLHSKFEIQEDQLKAWKRTNKEQDNKIKTLQMRLDDTLEMYEESQSAISSLRHHADELRVHSKESDIRAKDLEVENIKLSAALQEAYKMNEQQSAEAKRTENALKRLTERHENLHRENESNKEALNQMDSKLYDCRMEIVQLKRLVSKLELETTRLSRENNNLRHKGLVSSLGLSTFYAGSPGESVTPQTGANRTLSHSLALSSPELSDTVPEELLDSDYSGDRNTSPQRESYHAANSPATDTYRSPLMKAEEDLRMLRRTVKENLGQSLAHQRAIPRSSSSPAKMHKLDTPRKSGGLKSPRYSSKKFSPENGLSVGHTPNGLSPEPVTIIDSLMSRSTPRRNNSDFNSRFPSADTPTRFDVSMSRSSSSREESSAKKRSPTSRKEKTNVNGKNGRTDGALERVVENTLEKVRAGEFVTRPTWENRDTTTVKTNKSQLRPKVREEKLQERVQTIHDLELKYDHLHVEKRELESALSKVPLSGKNKHHYQKDKDDLDNKLDKVEKELGSVRMSLKRYNVLKTSGH